MRVIAQQMVRPAQYVALACYIIFLGFPLLWLLSASVKSSGELNSLVVNLLPQEWHWENYSQALARQGLVHSAANSAIVALASTARSQRSVDGSTLSAASRACAMMPRVAPASGPTVFGTRVIVFVASSSGAMIAMRPSSPSSSTG